MLELTTLTEGFVEFELPGGSPAISLKRLGMAADESMWSAVRFPAGFFRAGPVYLAVEEAYLMIEGEIFYSGLSSPAGSYTVIPAGAPRVNTRTEEASLALVRFDGMPRWLDRPPPGPVPEVRIEEGHGRANGLSGSWVPLGFHGSVVVVRIAGDALPEEHSGAVLLSLTDMVLVEIEAREPWPGLAPPFVAWIRSTGSSCPSTA